MQVRIYKDAATVAKAAAAVFADLTGSRAEYAARLDAVAARLGNVFETVLTGEEAAAVANIRRTLLDCGALGAVIVGILAFQEPVTVPRLIFVGLLLVGIVGLKLTA